MGNKQEESVFAARPQQQQSRALQPAVKAKPPNKTSFFYLSPLPDIDDDLPEAEAEPVAPEKKAMIEEIRVKWKSFLKMK